MKIELKKLPKSTVEMTIEIPAEKWKGYFDRAVKHMAEHVNIPGFRPGKISAKMLEQNVGAAAICEEVADIAVNDTFHRAATEHDLTPIGQPKVELVKIAPENPIVYKAIFGILPKIDITGYKKILQSAKIMLEEPKVEEKEIAESVDYLLNSRSKLSQANRPAKKGDRVEIDFTTRLGTVKIDKGESKNHPLIIGKSHFLPEFEAQITGMKAGEEKEFEIKYPADYYAKEVAGKKVNFKVKMNLVREVNKPEFNDGFAKSLGNFADKEAVRKNIAEGIKAEKTQKEKERFKAKIAEVLIKNYGSSELPEVLVEAEKDRMIAEFRYGIESHGLKFDEYLAQINKTEEQLRKEWETSAKNRINNFLINYEIAKKEDIKAPEEEIAEHANKILANYKNAKDAEKNIDMEKLKSNIYDFLINEKVSGLLEKIILAKN